MAREIKFKAWYPRSKEMSDAVNVMNVENQLRYFNADFSTVEMELIQFTGLKDKCGNEIYEGDILFIDGEFFIVKFFQGGFSLFKSNDDDAWKHEDWDDLRHFAWQSIIDGNIYENPELLEVNHD